MKTLTRGQLARASGVGSEAIHFYERQGLLPPPPRSAASYRCFSEDTVDRLNFIRRAKDLGFSLKEIGELLALHDEHGDRAQVKAMTVAKLMEVEGKIHDLQRMQQALTQLVADCSGSGPIIHALISDHLRASTVLNEEYHEPDTLSPST